MSKPKIIAVVGPTASGKSALAISLAEHCNGEIISADSRQVYRGLDLGTGKVTTEEMRSIPHHLLDVADPAERFSVFDFQKLGRAAIQDILSRGGVPVICGGTGLYVDTLLNSTTLPEVPPNEVLRKKLEQLPAEKLFARLQEIDPERAEKIDRHNPVRLVRAIEIADVLGKVPKAQTSDMYDVLKIGLLPPDEVLKEKIARRLRERIKQGMVTEAERLYTEGLSYERMEELGLEYRYMARLLQGKISREEFEVQLANEIWQYAKRQKTWFKRDKEIKWFESGENKEIKILVEKFIG